MKQSIVPAVAFSLILFTHCPTHAGLVAYDGFDYSPGASLLGQSGGVGFASDWQAGGMNADIHTNYDIGAGSLSFGGLATSGNRVVAATLDNGFGGITRDLSIPDAPGSSQYVSFLLRPEGILGQGLANGYFGLNFKEVEPISSRVSQAAGKPMNSYLKALVERVKSHRVCKP